MSAQVFVRNNGMGWHVRRKTVGWPASRALRDLSRERVVPWRGDCATTLVQFLTSEALRVALGGEVPVDATGT